MFDVPNQTVYLLMQFRQRHQSNAIRARFQLKRIMQTYHFTPGANSCQFLRELLFKSLPHDQSIAEKPERRQHLYVVFAEHFLDADELDDGVRLPLMAAASCSASTPKSKETLKPRPMSWTT